MRNTSDNWVPYGHTWATGRQVLRFRVMDAAERRFAHFVTLAEGSPRIVLVAYRTLWRAWHDVIRRVIDASPAPPDVLELNAMAVRKVARRARWRLRPCALVGRSLLDMYCSWK